MPPVVIKAAQVFRGVMIHLFRIHPQCRSLRQQAHAFVLVPLCFPAPVRIGNRLVAVAPQGVRSAVYPVTPALCPVQVPGFRIKGVIDPAARQELPRRKELVAVLSAGGVRPHGNHEMYIHPVQFIHQSPDIRKAFRIRRLISPAAFAPAAPVQHDAVQTEAPAAEFCGSFGQLRGRSVSFF